MIQIIPALLVSSAKDLKKQIQETETLSPYVQLDMGDGFFVPYTTPYSPDELQAITSRLLSPIRGETERGVSQQSKEIKYELHLMVNDPAEEMEKWKEVKNIFRAIFHIESQADPSECITLAGQYGWEAGIAINPDTPLTDIGAYYDLIDVVLFMTVAPVKQGQTLMRSVGDKIKLFTELKTRPLCAVDGGINKDNIVEVGGWGTEILNVGSALFKSENGVREAYAELVNSLKH